VCATETFAEKPTRLRSYSLPIHDDISATIFEAALATVVSSMEDYFPPVQIGAIKFAGGELSDNNPVREVYEEASKMWHHKPGDPKSVRQCLVSIGFGGETQIDSPYSEMLRRSTMETKGTAFRFKRSEPDYPYFRFQVDQGLQDVGLNEFESYETIKAATLGYLELQGQNDFNRCLSELRKSRDLRSDEPNPLDSTGLCLLSLDGGGVRGLSTLYILKSIMDRLNIERKTASLPLVKPCEVFDLIGGTSTGG
jgi:hypothetical protein